MIQSSQLVHEELGSESRLQSNLNSVSFAGDDAIEGERLKDYRSNVALIAFSRPDSIRMSVRRMWAYWRLREKGSNSRLVGAVYPLGQPTICFLPHYG
jgi:hypothetical protein